MPLQSHSIDRGGSSKIYLAHGNKIGRNVAFSLIRTETLNASGRERISREAHAMGKLGDNPPRARDAPPRDAAPG